MTKKPPAILITLLLASLAQTAGAEFSFAIEVRDDGVHRVDYADLRHTGPPPRSDSLSLLEREISVPMEIHDGGDGVFGPGDHISFIGRHLMGAASWFDPHSLANVYRLTDKAGLPRPETTAAVDWVTLHLEQQRFRSALPHARKTPDDSWYWGRISHLDADAFRVALEPGTKPRAVRVALSGLSRDMAAEKASLPQHRAEVLLNDALLEAVAWDGQEQVILRVELDVDDDSPPGNTEYRLSIRVPPRIPPKSTIPLIDVVLLDWVEADYPSTAVPGRYLLPGPVVGRRYLADSKPKRPARIRPIASTGLQADTRQADYLMIAHDSLLDALEPLVAFHRSRGLSVVVTGVTEIYDVFNHGITSPLAIRDYIDHTTRVRAAPAPRFVLLVGDASWDVYSTPGRARNLLPSLQVRAHEELAASDNGFVAPHGGNGRPALALGRIPAASAHELEAVVEKILAYAAQPETGAWRRQVAWVSDRNPRFQDISSGLAQDMQAIGFVNHMLYPRDDEVTTAQDQQDLVDSLNRGKVLVHFLGHGGRFVWRTGPPDYKNSSDLFTVENVEMLQNYGRLPLVLSMTCSSGPFDHPEAGSMAESFLMLPGRGAVGVLAASWRVPASRSFSQLLIEELTQPGQAIGEAIMRAKQQESNLALVESYNLLGDPALHLRHSGSRARVR